MPKQANKKEKFLPCTMYLIGYFTGIQLPVLGLEEAANAHAMADDIWGFFIKSNFLNFFVLALAIVYLGNKFLPKIIDERKKQISKELEDARQARIKADEELNTIREKASKAAYEIEGIKEEAKKTATAITKQIEEETEKELEDLKVKVKKEISTSYDEAIHNIKKSTADTAIKLAEEALSQLVKDEAVQKKLVEDFLSGLKTPNNN